MRRTSKRLPGSSGSAAHCVPVGRSQSITGTRRQKPPVFRGTLIGYRRHTATDDVLLAPGERDITAHVNFSALAARGDECGMRTDRLKTMAQSLMTAGKEEFARPLAAPDAAEERRRRLQPKTILFGTGGDVPDFVAAQGRGKNRREMPVIMKKAPETGALEWKPCPS